MALLQRGGVWQVGPFQGQWLEPGLRLHGHGGRRGHPACGGGGTAHASMVVNTDQPVLFGVQLFPGGGCGQHWGA